MIFISKNFFRLIFLSIILCVFFVPFISNPTSSSINSEIIVGSNSNFIWPIPGYTSISSPYGKRNAPTAGASTFHKGIDIPAPEGTNLVATTNGIVSFIGFLGGGGYTITITTYDDLKISYCHVSPNYIVSKGDTVSQGQIIGNVGPKYVDYVIGNNYTDSSGRHTNGATTGCHLHVGFRSSDNSYLNPLDYLL